MKMRIPVLRQCILALLVAAALFGCRLEDENIEVSARAELAAISIVPESPAAAPGTFVRLRAFGVYADRFTRDITEWVSWTSSNPATVAVSDTPGSSGTAMALAPGAVTITAELEGLSGSVLFTISPVQTITAAPVVAPALIPGMTQQFSAQAVLQNGAVQDVSAWSLWTSSDPLVASVEFGSGLVVARSTGNAAITAAFSTAGTATVSLAVLSVTSLSVSPAYPELFTEGSLRFTASARLSDGSDRDVTRLANWTAAHPWIVRISSSGIDGGRAVAEAPGTTMVSAVLQGITASTGVEVKGGRLVSIAVSPGTLNTAPGTSHQFTAVGSFSDGSSFEITKEAAWTSSDNRVAEIDRATGMLLAIGPGTATILAMHGDVASAPVVVNVVKSTLQSIVIDPAIVSMPLGGFLQLTATGLFSDGTQQDLTDQVTWSSSNQLAAIVGDTAGAKGFLRAMGAGTTVITAQSGNVLRSFTVNVRFF